MPSRRLVPLTFLALALLLSPRLDADGWQEEAAVENTVSRNVRDAAADYAASGDTTTTQIIYEGTVERVPFGHRYPTLVCAPLRICSIVLEPGETVLDLLSGDTQHWQTFELATGPGASTPIVGVRPMVDFELSDTCDKTTNLVITTDRRIYDVVLELPPCTPEQAADANPQRPYHRQLSFYYPDDLVKRWHTRAELRALQQQARIDHQPAPEPAPAPTTLAPVGIENLNWRYRVRARRGWKPLRKLFKRSPRFVWRPQAVFDDGIRTYIKLPPEARDLPAVFEVAGGDDVMVNFTVAPDDPSLLILPRVAAHLVLVLPVGQRGARLHLINEAAP